MQRGFLWAITIIYSCACIPNAEAAGRGCCSYHGGVAGCAGEGLGCNDGSLSPGCSCSGSSIQSQQSASGLPHASNRERAQKAVDKAVSLLGTPYVSGGSDSQGTDCSGLVQQAVPDYFPRRMTAAEQLNYLKSQDDEDVPANELKPGDLVYFQDNQGKVSHAAVVEKANLPGERATGIIAASSNKNHQYVVRQKLDPRGSLGGKLRYAGGGRPR